MLALPVGVMDANDGWRFGVSIGLEGGGRT